MKKRSHGRARMYMNLTKKEAQWRFEDSKSHAICTISTFCSVHEHIGSFKYCEASAYIKISLDTSRSKYIIHWSDRMCIKSHPIMVCSTLVTAMMRNPSLHYTLSGYKSAKMKRRILRPDIPVEELNCWSIVAARGGLSSGSEHYAIEFDKRL